MKPIAAKHVALTLLFLFLFQPVSISWNATGHRVTGAIAWENMTENTRKQVLRILHSAPPLADMHTLYEENVTEADKFFFMNMTTWADVVRDRAASERYKTYHKGSWHYEGRYWKETPNGPVPAEGLVEEAHLVGTLFRTVEVLKSGDLQPEEQAVELAWILHLVGDIHNPMHNASRVSEEHPDGDRGGNSFQLGNEWPRNLHSLWDGILDVITPNTDSLSDYIYSNRFAENILKEYPVSRFNTSQLQFNPALWNNEGVELLQTGVYDRSLTQGKPAPEVYKQQTHRVAREKLALAGYRLAAILNEIYDN